SHLFFGHSLDLGKSFRIEGGGDVKRWVQCEVEHASAQETLIKTLLFQSHVTTEKQEHQRLTVSPSGAVLPRPRRLLKQPLVNFLAADSADSAPSGRLWDALLLTPEEEEVTKSLRVIEPRLERLAFLSEPRGTSANILVKVKDFEQRLPLG